MLLGSFSSSNPSPGQVHSIPSSHSSLSVSNTKVIYSHEFHQEYLITQQAVWKLFLDVMIAFFYVLFSFTESKPESKWRLFTSRRFSDLLKGAVFAEPNQAGWW